MIPCFVVLNNKGGVGKTSISELIAELACVLKGKRVLLLDWDGQMNSTESYITVENVVGVGKMPKPHPFLDGYETDPELQSVFNHRSTITDLFEGKQILPYPTDFSPSDPEDYQSPRIDIIPGNSEGLKMLLESTPTELEHSPFKRLASVATTQIVETLIKFVTMPELEEMYDLVLIDSGPSESPLFTAALRSATHILCPYVPESKPMKGIEGLINSVLQAIERRRRGLDREEELVFLGLLPNMVDQRLNKHIENMQKAVDLAGDMHCPPGVVLRKLSDVTTYTDPYWERPEPKSLFKLPESNQARQDFVEVCEYFFDKARI